MEKLVPVLLGAALAISGYTVSIVSMVYWLSAPLSLYGRLLYMILGISVMALCMLVGIAYLYSDPRILLTHHSRSGRRLFCCTLCASASEEEPTMENSDADESDRGREPSNRGVFPCPLRWDRLSQTEVMLLLGINNDVLSLLSVRGLSACWYSFVTTSLPAHLACAVLCHTSDPRASSHRGPPRVPLCRRSDPALKVQPR